MNYIEDKWLKNREERFELEKKMEREAMTLAHTLGLPASYLVIGNTPIEWYNFIKGVRHRGIDRS